MKKYKLLTKPTPVREINSLKLEDIDSGGELLKQEQLHIKQLRQYRQELS